MFVLFRVSCKVESQITSPEYLRKIGIITRLVNEYLDKYGRKGDEVVKNVNWEVEKKYYMRIWKSVK